MRGKTVFTARSVNKFAVIRHTKPSMEKLRIKSSYIISALFVAVAAVALLLGGGTAFADEADPQNVPALVIVADGKSFTYRDEKIAPSDFTVAEQIERRAINAPLEKKMELVDLYLSKGADYKKALGVCFPLLVRKVDEIAKFLYAAPIDASITYNNKQFTISPEKSGRALDETRLYAGLYCTLKFAGGGKVAATTVKLMPETTRDMLKSELILRGRYCTDFSASTAARAHNVALALGKYDGLTIAAGESVSFNDLVGARTESNGFKSAKIIVDGKYTDGVGGGVCQASTAVYNAALLAGLNCAANAHSICPSYCPPGLDAMISGVSDLVITNTTDRAVRISVRIYGNKATVDVYGCAPEYQIVPESVIVKTVACEVTESVDTERKYFDATAQSGDRLLVSPGKDGVISETYVNYYKNGKLVKRAKVRTNNYKPTPRVIAVAP